MIKKKATLQTLQIIYEVIRNQLESQLQLVDSLDNKGGIIIGFNAIIITLAFSIYSSASSWLFVLGLLYLLISIYYSFLAYKAEKFRRDPEPRKLREKYSLTQFDQVLQKIIDNSIGAYEENRNKLKEKSQYINRSLIITFIGIILLTLSLLLGKRG